MKLTHELVTLRTKHTFTIARGGGDEFRVVLVTITDKDGATGIGEADPSRYYGAYATLMAHWRKVLGARLIEVDYENLIDDLEGQSRRLVDACELDWSDACLAFHQNKSPSVTASAAQVRRPLYRDSRDLWRRYETHLAPLADALHAADVTW